MDAAITASRWLHFVLSSHCLIEKLAERAVPTRTQLLNALGLKANMQNGPIEGDIKGDSDYVLKTMKKP